MLPGNGGIPFRTTDLGFCSDSSEVIFTIPLLAPVSHHHRLALPFCGKVTLFVNAFLIYRYYISHFFALSSRMLRFAYNKNVNIKFDIFSCFYRFAILHNTQPVLLYIFTFRQRNSKAATSASLSRPPISVLMQAALPLP